MSSIYFGIVTQPTNFDSLPANSFFVGIPFLVTILTNDQDKIGFYQTGTNTNIFTEYSSENNFGIIFYPDYSLNYTNKYYFSSLNNGNQKTIQVENPLWPLIPPQYINQTVTYSVPDNRKYNIFRYYTNLNYGNIDLNNYSTVYLGWSSSDISGNYGDDKVIISMRKQNGDLQLPFGIKTNNTPISIETFSRIPSGTYYYNYDFVTIGVQALISQGYQLDYSKGTNSGENTPTFYFKTQYVQSISATTASPGNTSTISINVGIGYTGYTYTLTINDQNNFSISTTFPYQYTSPSVNTKTYTATVTNSSDTNDTGSHSTTFIAYQYVTNLSIAKKIIQSAQNYVTWSGGGITDSFQYGTTAITTNGSTTFQQGNPVDSIGFTEGTAYAIQPTNTNENNGSYTPFYFDSIPPQTMRVESNRYYQIYTLYWDAHYTSNSPAPDGTRHYTVTITGNGVVYTATSNYNIATIPFSAVTYNVPYTVQVEDITIATNYYFFDVPTTILVQPKQINYVNTITWISPDTFNVVMGGYLFQASSPTTQPFIEGQIELTGDIAFFPLGSTESNAIVADTYELTENTFTILFDANVSILESVDITYVIGSYLYADTYSLSIYRNGQIIPLESTIPTPFTWVPLQYAVQYQQHDQLYIKSNQHTNYGLSAPITFRINATVTLDKPVYTNFSTIVATINNNSTFLLQLQDTTNLHPPIPVTFTLYNNQYYIHLNTYAIPLGTYQLEFLLSTSPAIMIASPSFLITSPVTLDKTSYTIASIIHATLYVSVPTTFTVQLQDAANVNEPISLPPLNAYLSSTYSFNAYYLNVTNTNYYLKFISTITLESPVFSMSTTYFTLNKPRTPVPEFARASSNILCVTAKKNNVPTVIITVFESIAYPKAITGKPQFLVPCGILKYFQEFNQLLKTLTLRDALVLLIQKYDIPVSTPAITNYKRYQYPTGNAKILKPILQYTASFRLGNKIAGNAVPHSIDFVDKVDDARVFGMCNDDTKTFSFLYTDMIDNAPYWLNTLPPIEYDTAYIYCVVRPINGIIKQIITASITLINNQLVFTPLILRVLLSFYNPYPPGDITILYASSSLTDILNYLKAAYEKNFINPATAI